MKIFLIASTALAATVAAAYLLKRRKETEQGVEKKTYAKPKKHRIEAFSKAKGFHNQHAMS